MRLKKPKVARPEPQSAPRDAWTGEPVPDESRFLLVVRIDSDRLASETHYHFASEENRRRHWLSGQSLPLEVVTAAQQQAELDALSEDDHRGRARLMGRLVHSDDPGERRCDRDLRVSVFELHSGARPRPRVFCAHDSLSLGLDVAPLKEQWQFEDPHQLRTWHETATTDDEHATVRAEFERLKLEAAAEAGGGAPGGGGGGARRP